MLCACRCQTDVSASTENRHLRGQGPRHVAAAMLYESRYLNQGNKKRKTGSNSQDLSSHTNSSSVSDSRSDLAPAPVPFDLHPRAETEPMVVMDRDDTTHTEFEQELQDIEPRRSTRVAARAPYLERVRWRSDRPAIVDSDESSSEEIEESGSSSDETPESDSESSASGVDEEDGYLSAWELLGEDFEREAHSLGRSFDNSIKASK